MTLGECKEGDIVWVPDNWWNENYERVEIIGRMIVNDEPTEYILYTCLGTYKWHNYAHENQVCYKENPNEQKNTK